MYTIRAVRKRIVCVAHLYIGILRRMCYDAAVVYEHGSSWFEWDAALGKVGKNLARVLGLVRTNLADQGTTTVLRSTT